MEIKKRVIFGIIIIISTIVVIISLRNNPVKNNNIASQDIEIENTEDIVNLTIINCTGKKIKSLNVFQPENEYYIDDDGNEEWYDILEGASIDIGGKVNISLENDSEECLWDFMINNEDGTFELNELLTSDFIYTDAVLKIYVVDDHLSVYDATERKEERKTQEGISFTLVNGTGKSIEELHISQKNNDRFTDENGRKLWEETLKGNPLDILEKIDISLETFDAEDDMDIMIKNEDGNYVLEEILSKDYIYDGAILELYITENYLNICDITSINDIGE